MRRWIAIALLAFSSSAAVLSQGQAEENARKVAERIAPVYPELARKLSLSGTVKLRVTVTPDGNAKSAQVLGGNPVLAKAAQDSVMRWKWAPAARESQENVELRFH
ncbi:MAG TPA: energy transducer TonB [Candidatus Sulfotelmatobacter sp.]|jgi:TonB family protein